MQRILFTVSCVALTVAPAFADPVQITAGQYFLRGEVSTVGFAELVGNGLSLSFSSEFPPLGLTNCPCITGNPRPLSFNTILSDVGGGTIDGVVGSAFANLQFFGPTVSSAVLTPDHLTLSAPFTMTGFVRSEEHVFRAPQPVDVFGSGIATAEFFINRGGGFPATTFEFRSVTYAFQAAPTPEPASLLLVGAAVAGVFGVRSRRNHVG